MLYNLFHKNIKVLTVEYDPKTDHFGGIRAVYTQEHIPIGVSENIQFWWESRLIPKNRNAIKMENLEIDSLLAGSCGFNLSDQYWISPENSEIKWETGNFFTNSFNEDMGKYISGQAKKRLKHMSSHSPDLFSNGEQDKRWALLYGQRVLIKYGQPPYYEQPVNEMLASELCRRLGFPHVRYSFLAKDPDKSEIYSECPCFVNENTEFVSAGLIQYAEPQEKGVSNYQHLLKCCKKLGMPNIDEIKRFLAQMMFLDYIIANKDRHYGNFGFIRNAETLEWLGPAPIFDTGNSMFYDFSTYDLQKSISIMENVQSKSFASTQKKQLHKFSKEIRRLDIDFHKLDNIDKYYNEILSKNPKTNPARRELLVSLLVQRINNAKSILYSDEDVVQAFLLSIKENNTKNSFLQKISTARKIMIEKNKDNQLVLDNYLKMLTPLDPEDLERKIRKVIKNNV